jgi:hypothetical protein
MLPEARILTLIVLSLVCALHEKNKKQENNTDDTN